MTLSFGAGDLSGVFGILPTPATADASSWRSTDSVDSAAAAGMVRSAVPGVDGLMILGTFGEGATLTETEVLAFSRIVVTESRGIVPVFAGATTLNTRDSIERSRKLVDLGVDGLFLGRPMWCEMDSDSIVGFYSDVAEALPETPVIIYDNPQAFKGKITPETYARLSEIPTIVGAKYTVMGAQFADDVAACGDSMRLLPMDGDWVEARRLVGDRASACWSPSAACGTEPLIRLRDAIRTSDTNAAETLAGEIRASYSTLMPDGDFSLFSPYNIPLDKARIAAAGLVDPGPARPPYQLCPPGYLEGAAEAGRRWAALRQKYASAASAAVSR